MKKLPEHLRERYLTTRGFRQSKRAQIRIVNKQFRDFRFACAWCPVGTLKKVDVIQKALNEIETLMAVKNWKR